MRAKSCVVLGLVLVGELGFAHQSGFPLVTCLSSAHVLVAKSSTGRVPESFPLSSNRYARAYPLVARSKGEPMEIAFVSLHGEAINRIKLDPELNISHITQVFTLGKDSDVLMVAKRPTGAAHETVILSVGQTLDGVPRIVARGEDFLVTHLPAMDKALVSGKKGYSMLVRGSNGGVLRVEPLAIPADAVLLDDVEVLGSVSKIAFGLVNDSNLKVFFVDQNAVIKEVTVSLPRLVRAGAEVKFRAVGPGKFLAIRDIPTGPRPPLETGVGGLPIMKAVPHRSEIVVIDSATQTARLVPDVSSPTKLREHFAHIGTKQGVFIEFIEYQEGEKYRMWSHLNWSTLSLVDVLPSAPRGVMKIDDSSIFVFDADHELQDVLRPQVHDVFSEDSAGRISRHEGIVEGGNARVLMAGYIESDAGILRVNPSNGDADFVVAGSFDGVEILETDSPEHFLILATTHGEFERRHMYLHRIGGSAERLVTELPELVEGEVSKHLVHTAPEGTFVYLKMLVRDQHHVPSHSHHHIYFIDRLSGDRAVRIFSNTDGKGGEGPDSVRFGFLPNRPMFWTTFGSRKNKPQLYAWGDEALVKVPAFEKIAPKSEIFEIIATTRSDFSSTLSVFHSRGIEILQVPGQ